MKKNKVNNLKDNLNPNQFNKNNLKLKKQKNKLKDLLNLSLNSSDP